MAKLLRSRRETPSLSSHNRWVAEDTVGEWVQAAAERLAQAGIESPLLEAQVIAAFAAGKNRQALLVDLDAPPDESADDLLARRMRREPLAYILGYREFYGYRFRVDPRVLIPRQETEHLVDEALKLDLPENALVADLGTGSGCIAITLSLKRKSWRIYGLDISSDALEVASRNASRLGAAVRWIESDLFSGTGSLKFDLIITNPPYVEDGATLQPEVRYHEPARALFAGEKGLDFYHRLAAEAGSHLAPTGVLLTEIGDGQSADVTALFEAKGWQADAVIPDLAGIDRVIRFVRADR